MANEHCFERRSVVPRRQVVTEAMKRAYGNATPDQIAQAVSDAHLIVGDLNGRTMATTRQVLEEERKMIRFAREGRG